MLTINVNGTIDEIIEFGRMMTLAKAVHVDAKSIMGLAADEANFARRGDLIFAVKAYRQRTNCGLKEAKDAIESSAEWKERPQR